METFVGCQRGSVASAIEEEYWVVAYESCGRASSSAAENPIKPEPSGEACGPVILSGPCSNPHTEDRTLPEEADGTVGGAASRKRGAPATSGESVRKHWKCVHGRQKSKCKECGGSGICPHRRQKQVCTECGGSAICPHSKQKYMCKECGGRGICQHGRQNHQCKPCGGSSICPHGKIKGSCKACGGSRLYSHGREKYTCAACGGKGTCAHGRMKRTCKECGGSAICAHGGHKSTCQACKDNAIVTLRFEHTLARARQMCNTTVPGRHASNRS